MSKTKGLVLFLAAACLTSGLANAEVFDAVNDFSNSPTIPAVSPSGNWSYGYSSTVGGALTGHAIATSDYFGDGKAAGYYTVLDGNKLPTVLKNITAGSIDESTITGWVNSLLLMHPGTSSGVDEYSVVRFTAPVSESYSISSIFEGLDATTTDIHILLTSVNGNQDLFDSTIDSHLVPNTFNTASSLSLASGDTIDFIVGLHGSDTDNSISNDSTGFDATITGTPEPASFALFGLGIAGLSLLRSRRKSNVSER